MKKIFFLLVMWVFTFPVIAQNTVSISGTLTDISTGGPLAYYPVTILADSSIGNPSYSVVYTNPNGFFQQSIVLNPSVNSGVIHVMVTDCQQYTHTADLPFGPNNMAVTVTFSICAAPQGCTAAFTFNPAGPLTMQFIDQSVGSSTLRTWEFGDNTTSNLQNPVHTFPAPGFYTVNLTIGAQGTTCWDQEIITIWVGDSISNGCQAAFTYTTIPGSMLIQFVDQSQSSDSISWFWNFGDPGSGTSNTSTLQNPVFNFSAFGTYNVCLTISGPNCYDMICMPVTVGQPQGCIADFEALPEPNMLSTFLFNDLSAGNIQNWTWNFGDGITQTVAFPNNPDVTHTYQIPGVYNVCLFIQGADSLCSDYKCLTIIVGDTLPGCQAAFTFAQVPGAAPNVFQFADASLYSGQVSWLWNFDDGTYSTEQNPLHVFPTGPVLDPYNVCLTISSNDSMCSSTFCAPVLPVSQGCQADFTALPAPNAPLTMNFLNQSLGINIWTYTWDFGDGTTQTVNSPNNPNVSHTYQSPGFYTACLTIQGDYGGCNSTHCLTIAVYDSMPGCQAQYTYYPDSASSTGNTIRFIDLSLGNPAQWFWEFGDPASGNMNISNIQNPVHTFSAPGTYYVCLTIGGPNCQSVWCGNVEVGPVTNCVNYFTYSQIGLEVSFEGHLLNNSAGLYAWDFGDNHVGTGPNVVHTYDAQGTYFVTLTTSDPATGCTYSSSQTISVGDSVIWGQLYGQVLAGNFPATQGMVLLFSVDTNSIFVPFVSTSLIDSLGVYYFPMVPMGNYVIYAIPFENGYLPTYYGNTLNWQNATVVQPSTGNQNIPYNINLISASDYPSGSGSIGGQISQGDLSGSLIDKITMLLKDQNGNTILYSQVDPSGTFDFAQLAFGTYFLYAELAGCETEAIQVIISESSPDAQVTLTMRGNSIMGIYGKEVVLDAGVVYPNPVKDNAMIAVKMSKASELYIELYSIAGQEVYSKTETAGVGETTVVIPANQLSEGIYIIKIYTSDGMMLTRKLVKTE